MSKPVDKRHHDVFLSHAHVDADFAQAVRDWLRLAGLVVWFDAESMAAGQGIAEALDQGIADSRAIVVLATETAQSKNWVKAELSAARAQRVDHPGFTVIIVCVGHSDLEATGLGFSKIVVDNPVLDLTLGKALLQAIHPPRPPILPSRTRDAYVSFDWRTRNPVLGHAVFAIARNEGFRLIGDSPDRVSYSDNRIRDVMATCGALLAVIPWRDAKEAWTQDEPRGKNAYRYFLREIDLATQLGLPCCVIAPKDVQRIDGDDSAWLRVPNEATATTGAVEDAIAALYSDWVEPEDEDKIFFATDLNADVLLNDGTVRRLIESMTRMRLVTGPDVMGRHTADKIMEELKTAHAVIADLTSDDGEKDNLNVAIEAGIAYSFGREVCLIARGEARKAPFMLRGTGQFDKYMTDLDRLALLRRIASRFKRKVYDDAPL